jgi:tRNA dimethylallyltransferase
MDLGTGKVVGRRRADGALMVEGIPHWLLDVVDPRETFTVAQYQRLCVEVMAQVRVPVLVGGTGLYLRAVLDGLSFPEAPVDLEVRGWGLAQLQERLRALDPIADVDWKNPRRLMRAIEIVQHTGRPLAEVRRIEPPPFEKLVIGIDMPMDVLKERIHVRLLNRLETGMVEEVRGLMAAGVSADRMEAFGLEYRYVSRFLLARLSYADMVAQLELAIGQYARRQKTWFRKYGEVRWMRSLEEALAAAGGFLEVAP